jgi:phospholipid/cholesterol/gamma-HCH transport system substrate-binding protein
VVTREQRLLAVGAIAIVIAAIAWLLMSSGGYHVNAVFENGGQLVKGANVTVGGEPVGKVESITLTDNNQANIRLKIDKGGITPLHRGTEATVRLTSLSGVANRYLSLSPGPNSAPEIPNDGVITADKTNPPVDLDQVLNAFTPKVRTGLKKFLAGSADQYRDDPSTPLYEPAYGNAGLRWVAPFFDAGARLAASISADDQVLAQFLVQTERATGIFAQEKEQFTALFRNLTAFSQSVAAESDQLDAALAVFPSTLKNGAEAFRALRPAMDALENLSNKSAPISEDLAPFFRKLRPLLRNAEPTLKDLRAMIRTKGGSNDLIDLLRNQPALTKKAKTAFPNSTQAMQLAQPILDFLRPYTPELTSWISHFGQIAANYDANGHYIRVQPSVGRYKLEGGELKPIDGPGMTQYPKTGTKRCPGTATQVPTDASSPFLDNGIDCDPSIIPPGP